MTGRNLPAQGRSDGQNLQRHAAPVLILVCGGEGRLGTLASAELFNAATQSWDNTAYLGTARSSFEMVRLPDQQLLAAGGVTDDGLTPSAEVYHTMLQKWLPIGSLYTARAFFQMVASAGKAVAASGVDFQEMASG